jgi:hypothetical protein
MRPVFSDAGPNNDDGPGCEFFDRSSPLEKRSAVITGQAHHGATAGGEFRRLAEEACHA